MAGRSLTTEVKNNDRVRTPLASRNLRPERRLWRRSVPWVVVVQVENWSCSRNDAGNAMHQAFGTRAVFHGIIAVAALKAARFRSHDSNPWVFHGIIAVAAL